VTGQQVVGSYSVSGNDQTISFSNNNQDVLLVPQAPLPDNTQMTLTVTGVLDLAGNAVLTKTTQFTTETGPDLVAPAVISENPFSGATNVPLNAPITLQTSGPVDPGTVNSSTLVVVDNVTGQQVVGSYSVSGNDQTISFVPNAPLAVGRSYSVYFTYPYGGITDLEGNVLPGPNSLGSFYFTTGTVADTVGPQVLGVSPANGLSGVPINTQVVIQFDKPIDNLTLSQVTLSGGGGSVNVIPTLSNGDQTLTLTPVVPLTASTVYTLTITGVQDLAGIPMAATVTTTFTTASGADLTPPQVVGVSPVNGATGVPTNAVVQIQFNKRMDPLTVTSATFLVVPSGGNPVAGTITVSSDGTNATLAPSAALSPSTVYYLYIGGMADLVGQQICCSYYASFSFTTGTAAQTSGPTVVQVSPPNGATGAPVNAQVVVQLSEPVDPISVGSSAVTVSGGGGNVAGAISVSSDQTRLTFTPTNVLAVSTSYTVGVSGFTDVAGNAAVPFTSSFSTGASGVAVTTGPTLASMSPASGATGVPVNTSVVLTFSEAIDPITVTPARSF